MVELRLLYGMCSKIYTSYSYLVWVDEKRLTGEVGHTFHDYELQLLWVTFEFLRGFMLNILLSSKIKTKELLLTLNYAQSTGVGHTISIVVMNRVGMPNQCGPLNFLFNEKCGYFVNNMAHTNNLWNVIDLCQIGYLSIHWKWPEKGWCLY